MFGEYLLNFVANVDGFINGLNQVQTAFLGVTNGVRALSQGIDVNLTNRMQAAQQRINEFNRALRTGGMNDTVFAAVGNSIRQTENDIRRLTGQINQARTLLAAAPAGSAQNWTLSTQIAAAGEQLVTFRTRLAELQQVRTFESLQRQIIETGRLLQGVQDQIRLGAVAPRPAGMSAATHLANLRAEEARIMVQMNTMRTQQQTLANDPATARVINDLRSREMALVHQLTNELKAATQAQKALSNEAKSTWELQQTNVRAYLQSLITTGSLLSQVGGMMQRLGVAATASGALFFATGVNIVKVGAAYQQSMDTARSVISNMSTGTAEAQQLFAKLEETVLHLAGITKFTASEVAEGAKFLGQAGLSAQETMAALPAVLNLSMAGFVDLGRSAEIAADFMNAFQLRGSEVTRVVDILTKGEVVANTTLLQLANAFSFAAPVAASLGQSIEDTAAALSILSNSGIKASRAGTGLAQIMSGLIRDTGKTSALMERYGSSFDRVNPQIVSIIDIIKEFKNANISAADVLEQFGERAGRAMLALMNAPTSKIDEISNAINNSFGEGLRQATIRWQNLSGAIVEFSSRVELIKIGIFKKVEDDLRKIIIFLTKGLDQLVALLNNPAFSNFAKSVVYTGTVLSAFSVVLGTLLITLGTVFASIGGAVTVFASLSLSAEASAASLIEAAAAAEADTAAIFQLGLANGLTANQVRANNVALFAQRDILITNAGAAQANAAAIGRAEGRIGSMRAGLALVGTTILRTVFFLSQWALVIAAVTIAVYGLIRAFEPLAQSVEGLGSGSAVMQALAQIVQKTAEKLQEMAKSARQAINALDGGILGSTIAAFLSTSIAVEYLEQSMRRMLEEIEKTLQLLGTDLATVLARTAAAIVGPLLAALNLLILAVGVTAKSIGLLVQVIRDGAVWVLEKLASAYHSVNKAMIGWEIFKQTKSVEAATEAMNAYSEAIEKAAKANEAAEAAKSGKSGAQAEAFSRVLNNNGQYIENQSRAAKELLELSNLMADEQKGLIAADPQKLARLKDLMQNYNVNNLNDVQARLSETSQNIKGIKEKISKSTTTKENEQSKDTAVSLLDANLTKVKDAAKVLDEVSAQGDTTTSNELNKTLQGLEVDRKRRNAAAEAAKDKIDWDKKAAEDFEKITEGKLTGYNKEIVSINNLTESWQKHYKIVTDLAKIEQGQKETNLVSSERALSEFLSKKQKFLDEIEKVRLASIKQAEEQGGNNEALSIAQAERDAEASKLAVTTELNSLIEKRDNDEKAIVASKKKQVDLAEQGVLAEEALADRRKKAVELEVKARTDFIRGQQVREAKARGDELTAARLENQDKYEDEKEKIDKIFAYQDASTAKLKAQALSRALSTRDSANKEAEIKQREKDQKEALGKLKEAANPLLSVHEEAAKALAKQVKSLQDLIALHKVMYQIKMDGERRAFLWSNAAALAQRQAAKANAMAIANPSNAGLQNEAVKKSQRAAIVTTFAGKALADANIGNVHKDIGNDVLGIPLIGAVGSVVTVITEKFDEAIGVLHLINASIVGKPVQALAPPDVPKEPEKAPGFAGGGLVPGSSTSGDNIGVNVNSGEVILNSAQQRRIGRIAGKHHSQLFNEAGVPGFGSSGNTSGNFAEGGSVSSSGFSGNVPAARRVVDLLEKISRNTHASSEVLRGPMLTEVTRRSTIGAKSKQVESRAVPIPPRPESAPTGVMAQRNLKAEQQLRAEYRPGGVTGAYRVPRSALYNAVTKEKLEAASAAREKYEARQKDNKEAAFAADNKRFEQDEKLRDLRYKFLKQSWGMSGSGSYGFGKGRSFPVPKLGAGLQPQAGPTAEEKEAERKSGARNRLDSDKYMSTLTGESVQALRDRRAGAAQQTGQSVRERLAAAAEAQRKRSGKLTPKEQEQERAYKLTETMSKVMEEKERKKAEELAKRAVIERNEATKALRFAPGEFIEADEKATKTEAQLKEAKEKAEAFKSDQEKLAKAREFANPTNRQAWSDKFDAAQKRAGMTDAEKEKADTEAEIRERMKSTDTAIRRQAISDLGRFKNPEKGPKYIRQGKVTRANSYMSQATDVEGNILTPNLTPQEKAAKARDARIAELDAELRAGKGGKADRGVVGTPEGQKYEVWKAGQDEAKTMAKGEPSYGELALKRQQAALDGIDAAGDPTLTDKKFLNTLYPEMDADGWLKKKASSNLQQRGKKDAARGAEFKDAEMPIDELGQPVGPQKTLEELLGSITTFSNGMQALALNIPSIAGSLGGINYNNLSSKLGSAVTPDISAVSAAPGVAGKETTLTDNRTVSIEVKNELDGERFKQMLQQALITTGFSAANV